MEVLRGRWSTVKRCLCFPCELKNYDPSSARQLRDLPGVTLSYVFLLTLYEESKFPRPQSFASFV